MTSDNYKILLKHCINLLGLCGLLLITVVVTVFCLLVKPKQQTTEKIVVIKSDSILFWHAADITNEIPLEQKKLILYGKELIVHTAKYLGPKGIVSKNTNGMNCQNCHLDAGTKVWGNNYGAVYATYPKYRARSGKIEDIYKRINDCVERSLNGTALALNSHEMQAIKAYIEYIGKNVTKGTKPKGTGIYELPFLERELNPIKGKELYIAKCNKCHQGNGQGTMDNTETEFVYPPLWGNKSYNIGAGLYRMSRFAGYIKCNMPLGANYQNPELTDEEAWDIAAYVNSQLRPHKDISADWPKIEEKPIDHPFGPYADTFTEAQHKYGMFKPIADYKNQFSKK